MDPAEQHRAAVALRYAQGDGAPRVVARGRGEIASEIVKRAKEAGLFVHESPALVAMLMRVDLDQHIPPQLYQAVAELLAWIWRLEHQMKTSKAFHHGVTENTEQKQFGNGPRSS